MNGRTARPCCLCGGGWSPPASGICRTQSQVQRRPLLAPDLSRLPGHRRDTRHYAAPEVAAAPQPPARSAENPPDFSLLQRLMESNSAQTGTIRQANRGGLIVQLDVGGKGFTPFSMVDPARLLDKNQEVRHPDSVDESIDEEIIPAMQPQKGKRRKLTGQPISVKIVQVDAAQKTVLLSEVAYKKDEFMATAKAGDVVMGKITQLKDFGVFVDVAFPDGVSHGVEGLVHKSELSWQRIAMPESVVREGDLVRCQVLGIDAPRGRISLSIKRLQSDPLQASVESLMPLETPDEEDKLAHFPAYVPASMEQVCDIISRQPGIDALKLGRQVEEKGVISQDLELYISKDHVTDGFNLIARSEGRVQEIHLTTQLGVSEIKQLVQMVLRRLL